jgi:hypothetical protein
MIGLTKYNSWEHLKAEWQTPLSLGMQPNIRSITDPSSDKSANAKHELLERCNCASNGWMGDLGLIEGNDHDQKANTNACEPTTGPEHAHICSSRLKSSAEEVDYASNDNGHSSSKFISRLLAVSTCSIVVWLDIFYRPCQSSSTECTTREEGYHNTTGSISILRWPRAGRNAYV